MKRFLSIVFLACSILVPTKLLAQGTYDFLRNDVSARAAALNGSFVSMTDDPNVLFYNPGALPSLTRPKASLSFLKHLLDVNAGSLSYVQEVEGIGTVGGGIIYINYGTFTETDQSSNILGEFSAGELAAVAGVGIQVDEQTSVGANIKGIYSSIAEARSLGLAVDLGVIYTIPEERLTLGLSVLNLGTQINRYAGTSEPLPLDIKIGVTAQPEHMPALLNVNFHKLNESRENVLERLKAFSLGVEFLMSESVRARVGYSNEKRQELKLGTGAGLAGFSLGLGILVQDYQFDYAFNSYGKIGGLHRVTLNINL
ncbi:MAG: type IX secretion system protein PorQ [Ignavibacteriae bacterium]|nr:type IX secretion system protein PorQ [Ignavibacteriota bacterium]